MASKLTATVMLAMSTHCQIVVAFSKRKVYLHWTGTGYQWAVPNHYHTVVTGDGVVRRLHDYNITLNEHTYKRNKNSVGLAIACMGGENPWLTPPTEKQIQELCREVANLVKRWGWNVSDITISNVMTHAEAASNKDGGSSHDNYGPKRWGGTGERWDLMCLKDDDSDDGGDRLRAMICSFMMDDQPAPEAADPLIRAAEKEMTVLGTSMNVLVDSSGVTWGRLSSLLSLYEIPHIWDSDKRRILVGSTDVHPRYAENKLKADSRVNTFELCLQGLNSPVILMGLIHEDEAYCQVLEFADEFGISTTFNPFVLHQRRGG